MRAGIEIEIIEMIGGGIRKMGYQEFRVIDDNTEWIRSRSDLEYLQIVMSHFQEKKKKTIGYPEKPLAEVYDINDIAAIPIYNEELPRLCLVGEMGQIERLCIDIESGTGCKLEEVPQEVPA